MKTFLNIASSVYSDTNILTKLEPSNIPDNTGALQRPFKPWPAVCKSSGSTMKSFLTTPSSD